MKLTYSTGENIFFSSARSFRKEKNERNPKRHRLKVSSSFFSPPALLLVLCHHRINHRSKVIEKANDSFFVTFKTSTNTTVKSVVMEIWFCVRFIVLVFISRLKDQEWDRSPQLTVMMFHRWNAPASLTGTCLFLHQLDMFYLNCGVKIDGPWEAFREIITEWRKFVDRVLNLIDFECVVKVAKKGFSFRCL